MGRYLSVLVIWYGIILFIWWVVGGFMVVCFVFVVFGMWVSWFSIVGCILGNVYFSVYIVFVVLWSRICCRSICGGSICELGCWVF